MSKRKILSIILIIAGIIIPLFTLPLSSEYYPKGSFFWNIMRNIVTGEIVVRDSVFEIVPDRDESLYSEYSDYKMKHPEYKKLPEGKIIEKFYQENYRNKMHGMEFRLRLQKQKVVTHKSKIAISYRYIFIFGVVLVITGLGIIIISKISRRRKKAKKKI